MKSKMNLSFSFILILFIIFIISFIAYLYAVNSPYKISSNVANILINNNKLDIILDVRTKTERNLGFFPGSINIPTNEIDSTFSKMYPNKNNLILVYCNTGQRARYATELLHKLGYINTMYITSSYTTLNKK